MFCGQSFLLLKDVKFRFFVIEKGCRRKMLARHSPAHPENKSNLEVAE
jgi:hypothetical protein